MRKLQSAIGKNVAIPLETLRALPPGANWCCNFRGGVLGSQTYPRATGDWGGVGWTKEIRMRKDFSYKGYYCRWIPLEKAFSITKDGFHIGWANTESEAKKSIDMVSNPRKSPVLIYGRVLRVEAQKTNPHRCDAGCKRSGHRYFHNFGPGVEMYGLPNKDLLLTKRFRP